MKKYWKIIGLAVIMLVTSCAVAATSDLYSADIPVSDQSASNLQQAFNQGIKKVLIKLSANSSVTTLPKIRDALNNTGRYVKGYTYTYRTENDHQQLFLHISYNKNSINAILSNAEQLVWNGQRPRTLLWLIKHDGEGNHLFTQADDQDPTIIAISQKAQNLGLPIVLPNAYSQHNPLISKPQELIALAQQYDAQNILVGKINTSDPSIQTHWTLIFNHESFDWSTQGNTISAIIDNTINQSASIMIKQLANVGSNEQSIFLLNIAGVKTLEDYATIMNYLQQLKPIDKATIRQLDENSITIKINVTGGEQALTKAIDASGKMSIASPSENNSENMNELFYQVTDNPTS